LLCCDSSYIPQAENIVDVQVPDLITEVVSLLGDIAQQRASLIQTTVEGLYTSLLAAFTPVSDSIDTNLANLQDIQNNTDDIVSELMTLEGILTNIDDGNTNNRASCLSVKALLASGNQATFQLICDLFDAFPSIAITVDYSTFPDLSSYITDLTNIQAADISQYETEAQTTIDDLFNTVQTTISDAQTEVNDQLTMFHSEVSTQFHDAVDKANLQFEENFDAAEYNQKIYVRIDLSFVRPSHVL
jgi:hypothetical protein